VVYSIVNFSSESGLPDPPKGSGIFFVPSIPAIEPVCRAGAGRHGGGKLCAARTGKIRNVPIPWRRFDGA
jgi:hypothetical protein